MLKENVDYVTVARKIVTVKRNHDETINKVFPFIAYPYNGNDEEYPITAEGKRRIYPGDTEKDISQELNITVEINTAYKNRLNDTVVVLSEIPQEKPTMEPKFKVVVIGEDNNEYEIYQNGYFNCAGLHDFDLTFKLQDNVKAVPTNGDSKPYSLVSLILHLNNGKEFFTKTGQRIYKNDSGILVIDNKELTYEDIFNRPLFNSKPGVMYVDKVRGTRCRVWNTSEDFSKYVLITGYVGGCYIDSNGLPWNNAQID